MQPMRERQLEQIMSDFYHKRFNVCAPLLWKPASTSPAPTPLLLNGQTIWPSCTSLGSRAGLITRRTPIADTTAGYFADARKRLDGFRTQDLGAGFMHMPGLNQGAGELLGEEQSGRSKASALPLHAAVGRSRKSDSRQPHAQRRVASQPRHRNEPAHSGLIPDDYLPDVHNRLMLYKRIASVKDREAKELQVEMIDRFGLLPPRPEPHAPGTATLAGRDSGHRESDAGKEWVRLEFGATTPVDPLELVKCNPLRIDTGSKAPTAASAE